MEQKHIRCKAGESVNEALERAITEGVFPDGSTVVIDGPGRTAPYEPGMIGTITVRFRESFAVVGKPRKEQ